MTAGTPNVYPKTTLTLSAAPDLLPEDAQAASVIERDLEAIAAGDLAGVQRIVDYVWPYSERDWPIISEAELRLLDGNR
jgi:hypothetical protein